MIAVVTCELFIYESHSLKEKRAVIKSIMIRLKQRFNVAVIESDYHDVWQRAELKIVTVSTERAHAERELQKALDLIDREAELERTLTEYEWL